ncbi:Clp protease ClpP [uncultured Flavobacterium sp.]|uniref:Clp protease ClpP n=1 Tax=uncultured Flavobacterium sp. TaxID=165435 RepID=UPI0025CF0568|nr:Clp protease ClpP [uncultured Flavobacterium sp.]
MTGNIYISGQIGDFDDAKGVSLVDVIGQVKAQPRATAFNVHINSEGGIVDVGLDIFNYLKSLKKPVTTIGSGMVASIATVIFLAGSQRRVQEGTRFMIHLPWGSAEGNAEEIKGYARLLEGYEKKLISFYKHELRLEEEAIRPLLREETWLSQQQLSSLGFTTQAPVMAVAKAKIIVNPKNHDAMNLNDKDRHWMESLFERVLGKFRNTQIMNKVVQDATGAEINFTDLPDDGLIETGLMATVDGTPAEGEYLMPDGFTYVFTAGELTEIIEPEEDAEAIALRAENKALKRQLNTIKNEVLALKRQVSSKFSLDGKKAAYRKPAETDRLNGMKQYLQSKKGK